ncbi:hypothetical protein FBU30_000142 [Linnemannia zychae]|nr:hypothetical protein FBU30_000142 [Linnemannia zychae]
MPLHVQVLDLPEIMDIIGHYLSQNTLSSCIQVSRLWHQHFAPILWHSFIFSEYSHWPRVPLDALRKYAHYIRHLEFNGLVSPWYLTIEYQNLHFLKIIGEQSTSGDTLQDPLTVMIKNNPGLKRLILFDVRPHPNSDFWEAVAQLKDLQFLVVGKTEIPPECMSAFYKAIAAYVPVLRLDRILFTPITTEEQEQEVQTQFEEEEAAVGQNEFDGPTPAQIEENNTQSYEEITSIDNTMTQDPHSYTMSAYEYEGRPDVTFSHLRKLYLLNLDGAGYDKQTWILEHAPDLEYLSWRGSYDFSFPTASFISALGSNLLSRLESLELRGSQLDDLELAQIISKMNRLIKLVAPQTMFGPAAMEQLLQHYETVRELDISGCVNVHSWMIQMLLCKFAALEVFIADMLSLQDITAEPWVCSRLRRLSLDFELGYVSRNEGVQDIIEEDSGDENESEESEDVSRISSVDTELNEERESETIVVIDENIGEGETVVKEVKVIASEDVTLTGSETAITEVDVKDELQSTSADITALRTPFDTFATEQLALQPSDTVIAGIEEESILNTPLMSEEESALDIHELPEEEPTMDIPLEFEEESPSPTTSISTAQWVQQLLESDAVETEPEAETDPDELWKFLVPYVHGEEKQRIVFERLGQLKCLEVLNIKQQTERPYSAVEQLSDGMIQKVLDLRLDNGLDLLAGLTRLREFYFPGPQGMEEREVRWVIEHWGNRLTHMSGDLNRHPKTNRKFLTLLFEHGINAACVIP